ncbi:MAG: DUF2628 domain-containing protein [Acetobacteraceae bacterium]
MSFFTAHVRANRPPILLAEGFRWGAFVFGPFWLLRHRALVPAALAAAALVAILALTTGVLLLAMLVTWALILGCNGSDLRRWSLERQGFLLSDVVVAPDREEAFGRFLARRPEQMSRMR